jgi:BolA protein
MSTSLSASHVSLSIISHSHLSHASFSFIDETLDLPLSSLVITSDAFSSKMQPARHRMIYALLRDEMAVEGGIHALQLRTMTPEEEERARKKKEEAAAAKAQAEAEEA